MSRILVIEDDASMAEGLRYNLEREGYDVVVRPDGKSGLADALQGGFDLLVLDWMLPQRSGFEILERLRARGHETPVILLTARGEEMDRIAGLRAGADDYITKPFSLGEFLARVEARLRHKDVRLHIDVDGLRVRRGTRSSNLTPKEAELLLYLHRRAGAAVPREELLREVWGVTNVVETRTLDNHVARLRRKLELNPSEPLTLQTIHGVGYRLVPGTFAIQDRDGAKDPEGV